jgi:hypothetical protein
MLSRFLPGSSDKKSRTGANGCGGEIPHCLELAQLSTIEAWVKGATLHRRLRRRQLRGLSPDHDARSDPRNTAPPAPPKSHVN